MIGIRDQECWKEYVHPEGQLYYTRTVDIHGRGLTVVTDYPLRPPSNHERISAAVEQLRNMALHHPLLRRGSLRWLEACILVRENDPDEVGYYFVNHQVNARTIFYLRDTNPTNLGLALPFEEEDTAATALQVQYWRHVIDYPSHRELSEKVVQLLGPLMAHSCLGYVTTQLRRVRSKPSKTYKSFGDRSGNYPPLLVYVRIETGLPRGYSTTSSVLAFPNSTVPTSSDSTGAFASDLNRPHWWKQYPDLFESSANCYSGMIHWNAWTVWRAAGGEEGIAQAEVWSSMMTELQTDWDQKNTYVRATLSEMRWWRTDGSQPNLIQSTLAFVGALAALAIPFQGSSNSNSEQGPATPTQQTEMISAGVIPAQPQHTDSAGAMAGSFSQAFAMFTCMFALANVIVSYKMRRMFKGRIMSRNDNTLQLRYMAAFEQSRLGPFRLAFFLSLPGVFFQWSLSLASLAFQLHRTQLVFFYIEVLVAILLFVTVLGSICIDPNRLHEPPLDRPHQELSNVICGPSPVFPLTRRVRFAEANEVHDAEVPTAVVPAAMPEEESSGTSSALRFRDFPSIREIQQLRSS
ncbi:hypothetical protein FRC04_008729 [Tulasnella sp. 424]|nr:hypothetical protein FRC04_008729 [Tulasnella sp. 424]